MVRSYCRVMSIRKSYDEVGRYNTKIGGVGSKIIAKDSQAYRKLRFTISYTLVIPHKAAFCHETCACKNLPLSMVSAACGRIVELMREPINSHHLVLSVCIYIKNSVKKWDSSSITSA